jgi:hypothetical protein
MFRIECFCDDNKLAKVLWLLQGHVYNLTSAPVVNATKKGGRVQAKSKDIMEMFLQHLHDMKLTEVVPSDVKEFSDNLGRSGNYYSGVLRRAVDAGHLRRIGDDYRYRVVGATVKETRGGKRKGAGRKTKRKIIPRKAKKPTLVTKQEAA